MFVYRQEKAKRDQQIDAKTRLALQYMYIERRRQFNTFNMQHTEDTTSIFEEQTSIWRVARAARLKLTIG